MIANPQDIVNMKIVAIKGYRPDRRHSLKHVDAEYILFEDGETIMELQDQDYYTYHDCDSGAKRISIFKNKKTWTMMMENKDEYYPDATEWPFS